MMEDGGFKMEERPTTLTVAASALASATFTATALAISAVVGLVFAAVGARRLGGRVGP